MTTVKKMLLHDSSRKRRSFNQDGQALTKGGRVSAVCNEINLTFDASYRSSDNTNRLLGRALTL